MKSLSSALNTALRWATFRGPWSRGFDVAFTWRRSPVQIWPGPYFPLPLNGNIKTGDGTQAIHGMEGDLAVEGRH